MSVGGGRAGVYNHQRLLLQESLGSGFSVQGFGSRLEGLGFSGLVFRGDLGMPCPKP